MTAGYSTGGYVVHNQSPCSSSGSSAGSSLKRVRIVARGTKANPNCHTATPRLLRGPNRVPADRRGRAAELQETFTRVAGLSYRLRQAADDARGDVTADSERETSPSGTVTEAQVMRPGNVRLLLAFRSADDERGRCLGLVDHD